jgi:hypothetical protein
MNLLPELSVALVGSEPGVRAGVMISLRWFRCGVSLVLVRWLR